MQVAFSSQYIRRSRASEARGVFQFLVGYSAEERASWRPDWSVRVDVREMGLAVPSGFRTGSDFDGLYKFENDSHYCCSHIAVDALTDDSRTMELTGRRAYSQMIRLYGERKRIAEEAHARFTAVRSSPEPRYPLIMYHPVRTIYSVAPDAVTRELLEAERWQIYDPARHGVDTAPLPDFPDFGLPEGRQGPPTGRRIVRIEDL